MVAHRFVERLAVLGGTERFAVTVIGEEPRPAYDRVRLTAWFDHLDERRLALCPPEWARDLGVRVITGHRVASIDRVDRAVRTGNGYRIPYERLVLATGSSPFVPPVEGIDREGVFVYRTVDDLERIKERAAEARSAVVVGGGLLGIEAADALRRLNLDVCVVESGPGLMGRQLDAEGSAMLEERVREKGGRTFAGVQVRRIAAGDGRLILSLDHGLEPLTGDLIVLTAGVRPRDELARSAGLPVAEGRGGVVVDDELRTADPAIHAIGECASHNGVVHGFVAPGYRMAETLAEIVAGRKSRFTGYTPAARLRLPDIDVWTLGDTARRGVRLTWRGDGAYRRIVLRDRRLVAAASVGPWREIGVAQDLILERRRIWPQQVQAFLRNGSFSNRSARLPVAEWPASAVVCNCLEISRGELSAARARGCDTAAALALATGASTVCGSCRPLLHELAADASTEATSKGLIAAAAVAVAVALAIVGVAPWPLAESVESAGLLDVLYRSGAWRQATGFGALGLALLATGFSLRKRFRFLGSGDLARWRLAHGALAALSAVALVAHTGLRAGSGFNRLLMVAFLLAGVAGAAAAAGVGRRSVRLMFWLHVLAVWPLPVLLAFHVVVSYRF